MIKVLTAFLLTLLFAPLTWASLSLSEVILDFEAKTPLRRDIWATNNGQDTYYIETEVTQIMNPGKTPLKRKKFKNPLASGLLVTPSKLVLTPGQRKLIRVVLRQKERETEKIYRIKIVPKLGKLKLKGQAKEEKKALGVKVLLGYEVLTLIRPQKTKISLEIKRNGKVLSAKNTGNTNVLLWKIKQCDADKKPEKCTEFNGPRVYAGQTVRVDLPKDSPAEVYEKAGSNTVVNIY